MTVTNPAFNPKDLEAKVKAMYRSVAVNPHGEFHFEMGRALAERLEPHGVESCGAHVTRERAVAAPEIQQPSRGRDRPDEPFAMPEELPQQTAHPLTHAGVGLVEHGIELVRRRRA